MTEYKSKVKYEAPIEINIEEDFPDYGSMAVSEIENMICSAVLKVGITVDKEELIKALRYDRGQYEKGYADGKRDSADAIEALQAEQKKTVTQIFGEEQQEWEEYCTGLMNRIMELKAQLPKRGEWIKHPEVKNIYGCECIECPFCGEKYVVQYVSDEKFCRNCGADLRAKMEVQG